LTSLTNFLQSGKPGAKVATVAAGGSIKLQWDTWPESHHGPVLDYLAKCAGDDCTSVSAGDLSFFKIDEKGLNDAASQNWASDDLIADGNAWTVTVPEDIAPGQYVLRHEIIALHSAQDANGAQNYPQCINIEVTGSGTAEPAGVAATELYTATDPGISLSIYNGLTDYEIPGPAVYSGGASGSAPSTGGSSSAAATTAAATTSAASSAAASSSAVYSNSTTAAATTSEAYPEQTGEPTFAGSASSTPCTTTITLTGSAAATATATQSSAPVDTSDNSEDDSEDDYEEDDSEDNSSDNSSSGSSDNTPTATSTASPDVSAVASSLPSSVLDAPIPTETSSSDKEDGRPSKALPEGFTLADLLEWVNYLLSKAYNTEGKHARDVTRR